MGKRAMPDGGTYDYAEGYYTAGDVLLAANIARSTLLNWCSRRREIREVGRNRVPLTFEVSIITFTDVERRRRNAGRHDHYSWNRLMQIVLTAELVHWQGWPPSAAAHAASIFTDHPWPGDKEEEERQGRKAGELFATGETWLLAGRNPPGSEDGFRAKVIRIDGNTRAMELLRIWNEHAWSTHDLGETRFSFTSVHLNALIACVHERLDERMKELT